MYICIHLLGPTVLCFANREVIQRSSCLDAGALFGSQGVQRQKEGAVAPVKIPSVARTWDVVLPQAPSTAAFNRLSFRVWKLAKRNGGECASLFKKMFGKHKQLGLAV